MNQYLLLRDNKQTGPYSVEELIKKGLKPYDLVWLDGRSAAWRYPSEIPELKAFAPAVEEQPYDRFYKKTAAKPQYAAQAATITSTEAVTVTTPVVATATQQPIAGKKIYVTLPAGMAAKAAITQDIPPKADQTTTDKATAEQAAAAEKMLNDKFARMREEKMRQAAIKSAIPAVVKPDQADQKIFQQQPIPQPAVVEEKEKTTPAFSAIVEQNLPTSAGQLAPVIRYRTGNNKLVMRSITAACLLLVGVIIGLMISNSRQQRDSAALDQLVKQIQERDRKNREAVQFTVTTTTSVPGESITDEAVPPAQQETTPVPQKQSAKAAAAGNRQTEAPALVKESTPVKDVSLRQTVKVIPAVVESKTNETPVSNHEAEKARKSIHSQVAVDANKYKIGVLGGISELQLTLSNNSLFPLDQVEVELRYLGPEKRVVKTQMLLFNDLAPGEQKTIEAPRTNRGVSVDYVITRINSRALGLARVGY